MNFLEFLHEAQFKEANLQKVASLYGRLFGKYFGGEFKTLNSERYTRSDGEKGLGIRLMNSSGYQLRLNFSSKNTTVMSQKFTRESMVLDSMDYWENNNFDFEQPSLTVTFDKSTNVVQIWKKVATLIRAGKVGTFRIDELNEDFELQEARTPRDGISKDIKLSFLSKYGIAKSYAWKPLEVLAAHLQKKGIWDYFVEYLKDNNVSIPAVDIASVSAGEPGGASAATIVRGKKETNETGDMLRKADQELANQQFSDPDLVFDDIEKMTTAVAKGAVKSLIVCGQGGIGKTYHVTSELTEILGKKGKNWKYHSGAKISARSFYSTLFLERDKLIVWDEADSLLKNDDIIMMLKPLLDTSGDGTCEYSVQTLFKPNWSQDEWEEYAQECDKVLDRGGELVFASKPLKLYNKYIGDNDEEKDNDEEQLPYPAKFYFTGSMIFISNMRANQIEDAVKSRSLFIDVYLSATDMKKRIFTIARKSFGEERAKMLYEALAAAERSTNKPITVRSLKLADSMEKAGIENWERLASNYA